MPLAVTHVIVPIIILHFIRDKLFKKEHWVSNKYIFLAGLAGLLPDLDVPLFTVLELMGVGVPGGIGHRVFFHNIWIPLALITVFAVLHTVRKVRLSRVFLILAFGFTMHLILDMLVIGTIMPLYPLNMTEVGLNLSALVPVNQLTFVVSMDAVLLLGWLWHEQVQHKIKDYF